MRRKVQEQFNGGLDLTQTPALIGEKRCHKAENVVFTRRSVRRRPGKVVSHRYAVAVNSGVNWLKRFYKLATTGAVSKYFLKSTGGPAVARLWKANTDWVDEDDYATTPITTWTEILVPNSTTNNSLYADYADGTQATCSLVGAFASKSWCYFASTPTSTDDTNNVFQVPVRTDGDKAYLMGLVPPAPLIEADTESSVVARTTRGLVDSYATAGEQTGFAPSIAVDNDGGIHIGYLLLHASSRYGVKYAYGEPAAEGELPASWQTETIVAQNTTNSPPTELPLSLAVDGDGSPHMVWSIHTSGNLVYTSPSAPDFFGGVNTIETIESTDAYSDPYVQVSEDGTVCVVYRDDTNTSLRYAYRPPATSGWVTELVDNSADVGDRPSMVIDSAGEVHVSYTDTTNGDVLYIKRSSVGSGGTWGSSEVVEASVSGQSSIAVNSSDDPAVLYGDDPVRFAERNGVWARQDASPAGFALPWNGRNLVFDSNDDPITIIDNNDTVSTKLDYNKRSGGTWYNSAISTGATYVTGRASIAIRNDYVFVTYQDVLRGDLWLAVVTLGDYFYRLTAEYDNGNLGESAPSVALGVGLAKDIGDGASGPLTGSPTATHTLGLFSGATRYDMTGDVTKIHVYRTVKGGAIDGDYFRAGSVACGGVSPGVPDEDFVDDVPDSELVSGDYIDVDKYMPPKFKTGVIWKERAVIANLKCRDTGATEGDVDSLVLGNTADASIQKNQIRFSDAGKPDIFRQGYFQNILPDGDSGSIQRLIVNPKLDVLMVLMENDVVALRDAVGDEVSSLSFRPKNIANSKGTPAPYSVVEVDGMIIYWSKEGIEVIAGYEGRNITSKSIRDLWNLLDSGHPSFSDRINMDAISKVFGKVDRKNERIYWAYPAATSTVNNQVLCFDYGLWRDRGYGEGVFSIFTGWNLSVMETWDGEGDRGELFGGESVSATGPWVYRLNYGNLDEDGDAHPNVTTTDNVISSKFYPGISAFGNERYKAFKSASVELVTGGVTATVKLDVDHERLLSTLASVVWGVSDQVRRENFGLPRTAIGVRSGLRFDMVDPSGNPGPDPWQLVDIAMVLEDLPTRMRP